MRARSERHVTGGFRLNAEAMLALLIGGVDSVSATQPLGASSVLHADTTIEAALVPAHGDLSWIRFHRPPVFLLGMAALVVVAFILIATERGDGSDAPATTTTTSAPPPEAPLPPSVDDAITQLEESVTP